MLNEIGDLRLRTQQIIVGAAWFVPPGLAAITLHTDEIASWAAVFSFLLNIVPTIYVMRRRTDSHARMATATMAAIQPALVLLAMHDMSWQTDVHLFFPVAMVPLVALVDWRPIILAAALIAIHHLTFTAFTPNAIYFGDGSFARNALHLVILAMLTAILCRLSQILEKSEQVLRISIQTTEEQGAILQDQGSELVRTQELLEAERENHRKNIRAAEHTRSEELSEMAREFEHSIAGITQSVLATAQALQTATKELDRIAIKSEAEAGEVASSAETANRTTQNVAREVAELSISIEKTAVEVSQHKDLTSRAIQRSSIGGEAVETLAQQSDTIGEATRAIARIAERTNLLALNAAIEAASAGAAGLGFSTVAQEVKALAGQAGEAATQIDDFLNGMREGSLEAECSFREIDSVIGELNQAAKTIRWDVEEQLKSADSIEEYAQGAAREVEDMASQSKSLVHTADNTKRLSKELKQAAGALVKTVKQLESSSARFVTNLRTA